jgi:hypothetical protein
MKTMLVHVDFLKASVQATLFAANWARDFGYQHIILFRHIDYSVFADMLLSKEQADSHQSLLDEEKQMLNELGMTMKEITGPDIRISSTIVEMPLLRSLLQVIADQEVGLVAIGSNADKIIEIAKLSPVRVLIVPVGQVYVPVKTILVPFDFKSFDSLEKIGHYTPQAARSEKQEIIVLNVDPQNKHLADEFFVSKQNNLHEYLREFRHEIYFSKNTDVLQGILGFIKEHTVDLIVALPGKHSFFYNLTHSSISTALYVQAPKPVLILK